MSDETEKYCTFLIHSEKAEQHDEEDITKRLESKKDSVKVEALEELLLLMLNGERFPKMLMTVIRFVVTSNDHRLKKLLMLFWEVVEKLKANGELMEEMILVCNALRNDLMHPNEYVRGATLRLLCKMKYFRILEPLKEAVIRNLSHRHSYVRRNAVMCVYSIVHHFGVEVMPEATEEVEQLLLVEGDLSTKRNAFLMLLHCDVERAVKYVLSMQDQLTGMGDIFQLAVLELVRKVCRTSPAYKSRFLRLVFELTQSTSMAVSYECANTLVSLSTSPIAIHQASNAYVTLLTEQSDNNVKLIVLDRLQDVRKHHKAVMESMVMDIFRALSCPSMDVRRRVMDICLGSMNSGKNIKDVVGLLKKEVIKTMGQEAMQVEGNIEYRRLLIRAVHACTSQYADQAQSVCFLFMDFLTESEQSTASEVVMFLRELIANHPDLRTPILQRLADTTTEVNQSRVIRGCLWLFGEYCHDDDLIANVVESLLKAVKPFPLTVPTAETKEKPAEGEKKEVKVTTKTVVLADGTYGTQNVYEGGEEQQEKKGAEPATALKKLLLGGDFLLSAMLGVTLTKLCLRAPLLMQGQTRNEVLFLIVSLLKIVRQHDCGGEKCDSAVRLTQCLRCLTASGAPALKDANPQDPNSMAVELMKGEWESSHGRDRLANVLEMAMANSEWTLGGGDEEPIEKCIGPDASIVFRQLRERKGGGGNFLPELDEDESDLYAAKGASDKSDGALFAEKLAKATQLTGLDDAVYVEAFLQVHSFDVVLELLLVNRTNETLNNVTVELSTQGDLKIVDRPVASTLEPRAQIVVNASIKVSSTETGVIFGYVTHEKKNSDEKVSTVLNELHIDILEYIELAWVGELGFRTMWSEFEWENKVNINTSISEVGEYLEHIMRNTNLSIVGRSHKRSDGSSVDTKRRRGKLTSEDVQAQIKEAAGIQTLIQSSSFVAVNLYSKSIFGEDALANISIEKLPDGKLAGSVRIRSRKQGIALSLGDRIAVVQRGLKR